jgi:DNA-binding CsgD family transcriptional regulator
MMASQAVSLEQLQKVSARLGDAAIDPTIWPEIIDEISKAAGSTGAGLLQSDSRTPDVPRSAGVDEYFRSYFADGWHMRDIRAERAVPLLLQGEKVVIDQDILTPRDMQRAGLYAESLIPYGLQWFAVIGFWAGPALWGLSIQRTRQEGPFEGNDKRILAGLSQRLTETAMLSQAVGRAVLTGMTNAFALIDRPALALDRSGFVIDINSAAERIFDHEVCVRNRRLRLCNTQASGALDALIDRLATTPDTAALPAAPIVVQRRDRRPLVIRILPVNGAARTPFLGARVLLMLCDLDVERLPDAAVIAQAFGLSQAETRLALLVGGGLSATRAADELGVSHETARSHLKAVLAKTGTHRQSELVALLGRVLSFPSPE